MVESNTGRPDQFRSAANIGAPVEHSSQEVQGESTPTRSRGLKRGLAVAGGALVLSTTATLLAVNSMRTMGLLDGFRGKPKWVPDDADDREDVEVNTRKPETEIRLSNAKDKAKGWTWEEPEVADPLVGDPEDKRGRHRKDD